MKGLLRKDFYQYKKYCLYYILFALCFFLIGIFSGEGSVYFLFYPIILLGMVPMTIMAYEEREQWNVYSRLLPYKASWLVSVKYIAVLAINIVLDFLAIVLIKLKFNLNISFGESLMSDPITEEAVGGIIAILFITGLLGPAFVYPLCFKKGVENARLIRSLYIILLFVLIGAFEGLMEYMGRTIFVNTAINGAASILGSIIISLTIFGLSWLLSVKWYEKREY
ncbi:MAG: ABC-2 transporter permease [Lachnospiraceae bacterium]